MLRLQGTQLDCFQRGAEEATWTNGDTARCLYIFLLILVFHLPKRHKMLPRITPDERIDKKSRQGGRFAIFFGGGLPCMRMHVPAAR